MMGLVLLGALVFVRMVNAAVVRSSRLAIFDTYQRVFLRDQTNFEVTFVETNDASMTKRDSGPWLRNTVGEPVLKRSHAGISALGFERVFAGHYRMSRVLTDTGKITNNRLARYGAIPVWIHSRVIA